MLRYWSFVGRILLKLRIYFNHAEVASISDSPLHGNVSNGAAGTGIMKMMGLKKSTKPCPLASTEGIDVKFKKVKKIKVRFGRCLQISIPSVLLETIFYGHKLENDALTTNWCLDHVSDVVSL